MAFRAAPKTTHTYMCAPGYLDCAMHADMDDACGEDDDTDEDTDDDHDDDTDDDHDDEAIWPT